MHTTERAELRGTWLGERYRIDRCLGIGGTGVVFEAAHAGDGRPVVVKTLRPRFAHNPDLGRRLRREAQVARAVQHPAIVPVADEGSLVDGSPYLVMDRVEGESLAQLLRREGTLRIDETIAIVRRVASVLHASHAAGFVHRDVKPEHVMLTRDAHGELAVYLLDFGVCAASDAPEGERERERGRVFGTPSYASPEQASGNPEVDSRADVFAVGVMVYEALSGQVPFTGSDVTALLRRIIHEDAPRLALATDGVAMDLDAVVARALKRTREERFPTMRALSRALAPWAGDTVAAERLLAGRLVSESRSEDEPTAQGVIAA